MGRALLIVGLVGAMMTTGVAGADPAEEVRLPIDVGASGATESNSVVVAPGDHLWKISKRHLDLMKSDIRVAPYWQEVIETNMPTLRSGDPDLIYPGEVVSMPPLTEQQ